MNDFAKAFTPDASFINVFGEVFMGREAIENRHLKMHEKNESKLKIMAINLRDIGAGTVIALIKWQVENSGISLSTDSISDTREGIFTQAFRKEDSQWLIAASHNTFISAIGK